MSFVAVCDGWLAELQSGATSGLGAVTGLDTTTVPANKTHLYSPVSVERVVADSGERHLAIWPEADPQVVHGATTDGSDEITTSYQVMVWQDAAEEMTRSFDDPAVEITWLALYEAIQARLYIRANLAIGEAGSDVRYEGGVPDARQGGNRIMAVRFSKRHYKLRT